MRTCTLKKLQSVWGGSRKFIEVTDREQAISYLKSKASCCWGGCENRIGSTGWVQLATQSPVQLGDQPIRFVCKASLVEDQLSHV
jgi:hypothetical protein